MMDGDLHPILKAKSDNPLYKVSRFTGLKPEGYVPIEVQAERSRRWATRTLLAAVLVLVVLNAHAFSSWASTLSPNWASVTLRQLAEVWSGRMAAAGLDGPRAGMRSTWQGAKALTWRRVGGIHVEVVQPKKRGRQGISPRWGETGGEAARGGPAPRRWGDPRSKPARGEPPTAR